VKKGKITVMHLRSSFGNGGGPEKTILNSPLYVDASKYQLIIVYLKKRTDKGFKIAQKAQEMGLRDFYAVEEDSYFDKQAMHQVDNLIEQFNVNILHTHDYKTDWWGWLLRKKRRGLKLVTSVHGWGVMGSLRERLYYQVGKLPLYFFDRIIAVNEEIALSLRKIGVPRRKMLVIKNAIDSDVYRRTIPRNINGKESTLGYIGRLSNEKRVEDLILSFEMLLNEGNVKRLLIAGDGPRLENLELLVSQLNLSSKIQFLGYVNSKSFFDQVDIFINPSLKEGFPNTILESMSMETTVIGTKVGGTGDLLKHNQTGLIIPTRKHEKIFEAVRYLIDNPEQHLSMIKKARELVCCEYEFTKRMKSVEKVYDDVLNFFMTFVKI
jgi:glycosyltransferase involved in cell wall biosynthesis